MPRNDEREFRLRPRKAPTSSARRETAAWSKAFKVVIHHARNTRAARAVGVITSHRKTFHQRCAVRVTYSRNAVNGQWRAHGRYLGRESATGRHHPESSGFDPDRDRLDVNTVLDRWQRSGDERLWKVIVSPEFGERIDLPELTRELMRETAVRLKTDVEWTAVTHCNTEHPHVHIALRGVDAAGRPLRLEREFIRNGIRAIAEDFCTRQIGHRTERDAEQSAVREVREGRYTSLDREIGKKGSQRPAGEQTFQLTVPTDPSGGRNQYLIERLIFLEKAGLAAKVRSNTWDVRSDFETVLRAIQRANDRQRTIAAHGALISDARLPFATLDLRTLRSVEGRVLVHGEEESGREAGKSYLLLEGTDACVYYVPYRAEIENARYQGKLRTDSFVRLRKLSVGGRPSLAINDFGPAEAVLRDKRHLHEVAHAFAARRLVPEEFGWDGWLGRYQTAVKRAVVEMLGPDKTRPASDGRTR